MKHVLVRDKERLAKTVLGLETVWVIQELVWQSMVVKGMCTYSDKFGSPAGGCIEQVPILI